MNIKYVKNFEELKQELSQATEHTTLSNPPYSIHYLGIVYIKTMIDEAVKIYPNSKFDFICDCGDNAALVHEALTMGFKFVKFTGNDIIREKLESIANQLDSTII